MITNDCRRSSNEKVDRMKRYMQIKNILKGKTMSAKEIAVEMFNRKYTDSPERNYSAPRLTELELKYRLVNVVGKKKCQYTGKMVSVYQLVEDEKSWEQLKIDFGGCI